MIKNEVNRVNKERANVYFWVQNSPFQLQTNEILSVMKKFEISRVLIHSSTSSPEVGQLMELLNQAKDVDFVMLGSIPTYSISLPKIIYENLPNGEMNFSRLNLSSYLVPESLADDKNYKSVKASNFRYFSTFDYLCDENGCTWHDGQNRLYYFDTDHLTLTGASALREPISKALSELLGS
jgi:hypothetical protein